MDKTHTPEKPTGHSTIEQPHLALTQMYENRKVPLSPHIIEALEKGDLSVIDWNCCDGRPFKKEGGTLEAKRFGGSVGMLVDFLAALNDFINEHSGLVIDKNLALKNFKAKFGNQLSFHSDNHNEGCSGCGYLNNALNIDPAAFGLTAEDAQLVLNEIKLSKQVDVKDEHLELGTVILTGPELMSRPEPGEPQAFVFNQGLDDMGLIAVTDGLGEAYPTLDKREFLEAFKKRRDQNIGEIMPRLKVQKGTLLASDLPVLQK